MVKFLLPLLVAVGFGIISWQFSARRLAKTLDENSTRLADPVLQVLTDRMAKALEVKAIPVHIYEVSPVNGLAAPDGRIFLTRGFYEKYRAGLVTGDEMASVIAHELGHVALGHARRRQIDFSGQNALRVGLGIVLARILPGIGPMIAQALTRALAAHLSRQDEFEADSYASALLIKAGIGTEAQKSLFRKLDRLTQANRGAMPAWFLSHPDTEARIAAIEKNESRWLAK